VLSIVAAIVPSRLLIAEKIEIIFCNTFLQIFGNSPTREKSKVGLDNCAFSVVDEVAHTDWCAALA
jgi:hypothetical protein